MSNSKSHGDEGNLLSFLLPICLFHSAIKSNSVIDKLIFGFSIWLPASLFIRKLHLKHQYSTKILYTLYAVFSLPVSILLSWITSYGATKMFLHCFIFALNYYYIILNMLWNCPKSFSLVEAQIIAQGILLFVYQELISLQQFDGQSSLINYEAMELLQMLLLGLLFLMISLYEIPSLRKGIKFHFVCFSFAIGIILIWCFSRQHNFFNWFWSFLTYSHKRVYLLFFWMLSTLASIMFVIWVNQRPVYKVTTIDRKYFHFIINAIYIPGIIYDVQFLCIASGIALGAFIILEVYRILKVPVIGPLIDQAFRIFLDEKDSGVLILTHIYLLIGCSSPIWLSSFYVNKNVFHISLLSGVISVGFGDSFAAIGGTMFGKHRWKDSKKTVEGTICAIISQLILLYLFLAKSHELSLYNISIATVSALLTSLLEAKTTHIDNLVLPLFMFSFLVWID